MAKSRIRVFLERLSIGRAKPNTISPGLTKSRKMYGTGGKIKTQPKKRSS